MTFEGEHRRGPDTARLVMRAFEVGDAEAFFRLNSHPDVIRYTGEAPCGSVEVARAQIGAYADWDRYGIGRWATVHKGTGEVMGFAGLKYLPEFDQVDLGYRFLPQYWGKGLATEASLACLAYGFDTLGLQQIVAFALADNGASLRVLDKVGFSRREPILYDGEPAEYYVMEARDFGPGRV